MWCDEHLCNRVCVCFLPHKHTRTPWGVKSTALFKQCACVCPCCAHWCGCVNCVVRRTSVLLFFSGIRERKGNKEVLACWSQKYLLCLFSAPNTFSHCCVTKTWKREKSAYRGLMNGADFSLFLHKISFLCVFLAVFTSKLTGNQNWP